MRTYAVYKVEVTYSEDGRTSTRERFIGNTRAVSEAKACSNIRYRARMGSYSNMFCDTGHDTSVEWYLEARAV